MKVDKSHIAYRALRRDFMIAAMETGRKTLEHINQTDPELGRAINRVFPNPGRAAFWMVTGEKGYSAPPLQELARDGRNTVLQLLANYVPYRCRQRKIRSP